MVSANICPVCGRLYENFYTDTYEIYVNGAVHMVPTGRTYFPCGHEVSVDPQTGVDVSSDGDQA